MTDQRLSKHFGAAIAANSRPGPGRGPAPDAPRERWWWLRWRMFDDLMWEAIETLDAHHAGYESLLASLPEGWPGPASGLMSIRQMEWVRVHVIGGRHLDARGRLFA